MSTVSNTGREYCIKYGEGVLYQIRGGSTVSDTRREYCIKYGEGVLYQIRGGSTESNTFFLKRALVLDLWLD